MPPGETNRTEVNWFSVAQAGRSKPAKLSAESTPVQWTGSPTRSCSSQTSVRTPRSASRAAMNSPPGPPPTMRTSTQLSIRGCIISGVLRHATVALLPRAGPGDPEREQDQLHVQPEARALQVHLVDPEFAGARDVAGRVHLRQPGQAGPDAVAGGIAGNLIQRHQPAVATHLHFARSQRPRSDKAHVAGK